MKTSLAAIFILFCLSPIQANLVLELSVENQEVQGTDFLFDIYLTRHTDSHGDIFLTDMDLVLNFNSQYFSAPTLTVVENVIDATGHCEFTPTSNLTQDEIACQTEYFSKTATTEIVGNLLTINLFGPEPIDAQAFFANIAWVDGQPNVHRLGRFKISGINDQSGMAGLSWAATSEGTMTKVFSLQNFAPWDGKPVDIMTIQPSDIGLDSIISSIDEKLKNDFSIENIYPNPATDNIIVELNTINQSEIILQIIDSSGRIFYRESRKLRPGPNRLKLNIADVPNGIYELSINSNNWKLSKPLFKG